MYRARCNVIRQSNTPPGRLLGRQVAYPTNFTPFPFPLVEHEWFDNAVKMAKYQIVREMDKLGTKVL
jgi:hypothetical protein